MLQKCTLLLVFACIASIIMASKSYVVCFVCMSNTCRSPMAEYLLKHKITNVPALSGSVLIQSRALTDAYEPPESPASSQGVEVWLFFLMYNNINHFLIRSSEMTMELICQLIDQHC